MNRPDAPKPNFRNALKEFYAEHNDGRSFDKDTKTDIQRSYWLVRFYVEKIIRPQCPQLVPTDNADLMAGFIEGSGDSQVDFIAVQGDVVVIILGKYRSGRNPEDTNEVFRFRQILDRLHPKSGTKFPKAARIREFVEDINWDEAKFELHFVTLAPKTEEIINLLRTPITSAWLYDPNERVDLRLYDEHDLNDQYRDSVSAEETIKIPVELRLSPFPEAPWLVHRSEHERQCFIGKIKAKHLRILYEQHRYRLFSLNIRNYIGNTSVNKQMAATAASDPTNFFYFNNGISAVATKITPDPTRNVLLCERFSIINGAQTVRTLAKTSNAAIEDLEVLIRVSAVTLRQKQSDMEFLDSVTKFNNTQNAIKVADFRSNDAIQNLLRKRFSSIAVDGKHIEYYNKRSGEQRRNVIPIGLDDFARTIHAFRLGPVDYYGGTNYLFDTASSGGYNTVFGDGIRAYEALDEDVFLELAGIWFFCERVREVHASHVLEKVASEQKLVEQGVITNPVAKNALERRWLVFFAVGELLRAAHSTDVSRVLRAFGDINRWENDAKAAENIRRYAVEACSVIYQAYSSASRLSAGFTHRNWFRQKETLAMLRRDIVMQNVADRLPKMVGR